MSCNSLNQQSTLLNASVGALPEGFCPQSMQELSEAIVSRLIITPNTAFSSFAIGSQEPSSNIGPWLKNCEEWFIFNDATASYVPIEKGGFNNMEYKSSSNTFVVPPFIYKLKVSAWGAGGGGGGAGTERAGGGGGGFVQAILNVIPGQNIGFSVGVGGTGVNTGTGTNGGNTTFLTLVAGGGQGAPGATAGPGGTANGGVLNIPGQYGEKAVLAQEGTGNGGDSPQGGAGGTSSPITSSVSANGIAPGGGGAGAVTMATGVGNGANGGILIEY